MIIKKRKENNKLKRIGNKKLINYKVIKIYFQKKEKSEINMEEK